MRVAIEIPTPLRRYAGDQARVEVAAQTVGEALRELVRRHQGIGRQLYGDDGRLRSFVNVFVNDEDIRHLDQEETGLRDGDTVMIIPSIAGGSP